MGWLIHNSSALKIQGIIFSRDSKRRPEIWGYSQPGVWRPAKARGSIAADHVDHVHVYFQQGAMWQSCLNTSTLEPGTLPVGVGPDVSLSELISAAETDPQKPDQSTTNWAVVYPVEQALAKEGLLSASLVDGHYGTATVAAYAAWQRRLGYTGADADGIPGRASLAELGEKYGFVVG